MHIQYNSGASGVLEHPLTPDHKRYEGANMAEKYCNKCKQTKPADQFHKNSSKPDGLKTECISCYSEYNKKYYKNNKERIKKKGREFHLKKYGLTQDGFESLFEMQGGACDICGGALKGIRERRNGHTAIDHCHKTGKLRALLCMSCNSGLGYFTDSPEKLLSAANYVLKHSTNPPLTQQLNDSLNELRESLNRARTP